MSTFAYGDRVIFMHGGQQKLGRVHASWVAADGSQVCEVDAKEMQRFMMRDPVRGSRWRVSILFDSGALGRAFEVIASDTDDALERALRTMWPQGYRAHLLQDGDTWEAEVPVHSADGVDFEYLCFTARLTELES